MASQQYSFPILTDDDMTQFLLEIQYPFRPEWKKPTPQMVNEIFPALVDIVVGVDSDRLSRPEAYTMEKHNIHPEVYARGLPELGMLMMIFEVMEACCVYNFSFKDFQAPTWGRLRTILSAVINFVRFQHEFFVVYERTNELTAETEKNVLTLKANIEALTDKYNQYVGSPEMKLLKQLQKEQEELEKLYQQKKYLREQSQEECRKAVVKLNIVTDGIQSCDDTIKGLKYELDLLKSRDITGLLHEVENLKAKVEVQQSNNEIQQVDINVLRSKQDLNTTYARVLNELKVEFEDYNHVSKLHRESQDRLAVLEKQLINVRATTTSLTEQRNTITDELKALKNEFTRNKEQFDQSLQTKQRQIHQLIDKKKRWEANEHNNMQKIDNIRAQMNTITMDMDDSKEKHNQMIATAVDRLIALQRAVDNYHAAIIEANNAQIQQQLEDQNIHQQ